MDWSTIDKRTLALIKGKLRQIFRWSKEKKDYMAKRTFKAELDGKVRAVVNCDSCGVVMGKYSKEFQLDHIVPIGSCSPQMVALMFDVNNFQILCTSCHDDKTKGDLVIIKTRDWV